MPEIDQLGGDSPIGASPLELQICRIRNDSEAHPRAEYAYSFREYSNWIFVRHTMMKASYDLPHNTSKAIDTLRHCVFA